MLNDDFTNKDFKGLERIVDRKASIQEQTYLMRLSFKDFW